MQQNKPLPFEQFIEIEYSLGNLLPKYNNFPLHFNADADNILTSAYRETPHSQRFQKEHSDLDALLCEKMANRDKSKDREVASFPFEPDLYKAYVIMHDYVPSDEMLFA